jgi:pyruvate/2-oxoglutarate dehydrogenase complex dihydrolipoamide acyltransferase (E2) component
MKKTVEQYEEVSFPKNRELVITVVELGLSKHRILYLIELDVTQAHAALRREKERTGESLSFTAWIARCIAQAISEHKQVHALKRGRTSMLLFKDVDIMIIVEKTIDGEAFPLPYLLKQANQKSVRQIHDEIRAAQTQAAGHGDIVLGGKNPWFASLLPWMPKVLLMGIGRWQMRDPFRHKKAAGTVLITALGMMGHFSGWAVPIGTQPVCFGVGGIARKPGVNGDRIEIREYLSLSLVFDHDVVDGAPIARFMSRLTELMESGFGLPEEAKAAVGPLSS